MLRRIEPADITTGKTQVVLDEGRQKDDKAEQVEMGQSNNEGVTIQSVDRALSILEYIAAATEPMKLQDIAQDLNLKTPTCYNLLNSLVKRGFVTRIAHPRAYHLGPKFGEMARHGSAHFDIHRAGPAGPHEIARPDRPDDLHGRLLRHGTDHCRRGGVRRRRFDRPLPKPVCSRRPCDSARESDPRLVAGTADCPCRGGSRLDQLSPI
ncbi:helix-turn-helix domain-containing protein [Breoghania sp.]|uniref:helix-turn-helix domain-containing protein n=1 Tax=Breoghania sp. TaxID=2065378 RepID=UPI00260CCB28|nr:helix-turn-helix domain-containing protein [Breoghania sp.]MDJ0933115.1 helix-turn-helix domain-containing protein [Breoghania sp.]